MSEFVICIDNSGNGARLIVDKVYETLTDRATTEHSLLRVLDQDTSEPDAYLYSSKMFAQLDLPHAVKRHIQNHRQTSEV